MLNNGRTIPQFGFGVFQIRPEDTTAAVAAALQAGYRHIDTAEMYGNEKQVGEAIARSGLDRSDVFVTTKLGNDAHVPDDARRAFSESLNALGFDYVDLFLIHWPLPTRYDGDYVSTWKTLVEFYRDGRGPLHRRLQLPAASPAAAARGVRDPPRCQPGRGASVPDPAGPARVLRRA
jgi:2,5-diketo-D-gluconate reductase A